MKLLCLTVNYFIIALHHCDGFFVFVFCQCLLLQLIGKLYVLQFFCVNYCAKASHENPWLLRLGIKLQWIVRCPLTILAWDRAQLFLLILKLIKMTYDVKMKLNRTLNFPHAWFLVEYMRAWGSLDGSGVDCEMVRRGIVRHETVRHDLVKHVKHESVRHEAVRHEIVSRRSGWLQS